MTEGEWQTGTTLAPMLACVRERASDRKLRLFACACCRQKWAWLNDLLRAAVEVAEGYADGQVAVETLRAAQQTAWVQAPSRSLHIACWVADGEIRLVLEAAKVIPSARRCAVLRDQFGPLPFRQVPLHPAWWARARETITPLAQAIYDGGCRTGLPVLGDALEEAGCTDADLLTHCHQPGEHFRGCWLVDLLLGKE